jgi:ribosomal protein S18 acetylase RimI-like enzyme
MLLKKCLAQAASLHLPTYLNATPKGMPLYRKYGFQTLEEYELEYMKDLNLAEPYINYCMLAPAPSTFAPAPSTAPLPVVVRPLPITYDSMIKVNKLYDAAFGVTELTRICFGAGAPRDPNGPSEAEMSAGRAEWALKILRSKPHAFRYDAAYDAKSGAILGVAKWYHVDDPFAEHWPNGRPEDRPSRGNKEASDAMFGELKRRREAMFRAEGRGVSYSYMSLLIVDPAAQRRGVGSALLRQGLSAIDERGEECFVDASPAGLGLYQKFGWKEVTQVTLDLTRYGGEGSETSVGLIRPVGGSTGS